MRSDVKQHQVIKVPTPLHAQFKALAAKRGVTMVDIVHGVVRNAIEAGEIPDEVPGVRVRLVLDLDSEEHGPFVIITTPEGDLPPMTRETAETVARHLCRENVSGEEVDSYRGDRRGFWSVTNIGTAVELTGRLHSEDKAPRIVMTPALAKDLARKIRTVATGAVTDDA